MKTPVLSLICTAAVGLASTSYAGQNWPLEPDAVLGVKIGAPIAASALPRCEDNTTAVTDVCLRRTPGEYRETPATFKLESHPFPYASITVMVDDAGVVSRLLATMDQQKFSEFAAVLLTRYGPTTSQSTEIWQSRGGARVPSATLTWTGSRIQIIGFERGHSIDRSVVDFADIAADKRADIERKLKIKGAASKL